MNAKSERRKNMALRTNSKQVRSAVMDYIRLDKDYLISDYEIMETDLKNDDLICLVIYDIFRREKLDHDVRFEKGKLSEYAAFEEWASGLAMGGLFAYYYMPVAVDLVGKFLQETEEEKARYSETEAEKLLTYLIYREIISHKNRVSF